MGSLTWEFIGMITQGLLPDADLRIGIDLGGTKIEIVALDRAGVPRLQRRIPTPQGDYSGTIEAIGRLVDESERSLGSKGRIGLGIPGAESEPGGPIKNANSTCLNGRRLRRDLETRLGRSLRIDNDANCFALSEAVDGAGQGAAMVFGVILGTGVGGGIVLNGSVWGGANRIAGEWGHTTLPHGDNEALPPARCYCGRQGCVETWLSGPGLAADHFRHTGQTLSAAELADAAGRGDAAARDSLDRYAERLGRSLAQVINLLDPEVIVLGGGLSQIESLYEAVPRAWTAHVFSDRVRTRLCRNRHGDASGVRGAAWLWDLRDREGEV